MEKEGNFKIFSREKCLSKIDGINERLKMLMIQGESSNNKTLKNLRVRRNRIIRKLIADLAPEISVADELNKVRMLEK